MGNNAGAMPGVANAQWPPSTPSLQWMKAPIMPRWSVTLRVTWNANLCRSRRARTLGAAGSPPSKIGNTQLIATAAKVTPSAMAVAALSGATGPEGSNGYDCGGSVGKYKLARWNAATTLFVNLPDNCRTISCEIQNTARFQSQDL